MKLRKNKRYIVYEIAGDWLGLTMKYVGLKPEGHLFIYDANYDSGLFLTDDQLKTHVKEYSVALVNKIDRKARVYLAAN